VVFRVRTTAGGQVLLYGFAGQVGGIGVNDQGLALTINSLINSRTVTQGVGSALLIRMMLERCSTVGEAVRLLETTPRSAGGSYVMADGVRLLVAEATPDEVALIELDGADSLAHTNHILKAKVKRRGLGLDQNGDLLREPGQPSMGYSYERLDQARQALADRAAEMGAGEIQALLTTSPINYTRELDPSMITVQSMIVSYGPPIEMFASAGCDPGRAFNRYTFHGQDGG
jgi:hypothetical protein